MLFISALVACVGEPNEQAAAETHHEERQPNILIIMADDLGYTDLGIYGSEIETPNIDSLARSGVMFQDFYAASTCSPTRAMLLTGVDNHLGGMGSMYREQAPNQLGKPGYEGHLNFRVATIAELLKDAGYHTYMTGKWHLGYGEDTSPAARGFERSFAALAGGSGQFNMMPMVGPGKAPFRKDHDMVESLPDDFYSTRFYTHELMDYIDSDRADGKPFFAYLAYTAVHWPLQAPRESIQKFEGDYDSGYDELQAKRVSRLKELGLLDAQAVAHSRLAEETAWDELDAEERARQARLMEVYAAMVSDVDQYVGELVEHLKSIGEYENTFILFMSDNGAEGHPMDQAILPMGPWIEQCCDNSLANMGNHDSFLWYGANWARASTGPWRMFKGFSSEGGIRVPAIIHYPRLTGEQVSNVHREPATVLDVVPTLLELSGISHPGSLYNGREIEVPKGASMLPMLRGEVSATHSPDKVYAWELFGKTALRQGDWKIVQEPHGDFWSPHDPLGENYKWMLFNLAEDPTELDDISAERPDKLNEMLLLWDEYAAENNIIIPNKVMGY